FIVGMGLLFLRLLPLMVRGIYALGKRFWRPASYASYMEIIKNGRKQQFIMLFMILTVSLGMFHATVARTILQNAQANVEYLDGTDVIIREVWNTNATSSGEVMGELRYYEPDYSKYAGLDFARGYTRVIRDGQAYVPKQGSDRQQITLLGIHTREYGENTWLDEELLGKHYYELLNELAVEPTGVLVSRNFQTQQDYKVGDTIRYYSGSKKEIRGKIVDFVDYWPGYEPVTMSLNAEGGVNTQDNFLVIANYATLQKALGTVPYEVWISLKEGQDSEELYQWVQDNNVHVVKYVDRGADLEKVVTDPLMQGTNGILTMGFIVTLILCAVGYLIYWIMSIRSREMMFGVLRACGMHKGEMFYMLINEQIFSGVFAILGGVGIGHLSSQMFVPMLQTAYAASNQVLPMELITRQSDMLRLYGVVAGVMALCLVVLIVIVFRMNVVKALKLGEE
ncbi:MAG: ABC transporter permease, partial [Acetatifactor sp.]|nr:ABC transporter permease [Acetatifactor sp.]